MNANVAHSVEDDNLNEATQVTEETNEETTDAEPEVNTRVRRVNSTITVPDEGSIGKLTLEIHGSKTIDFSLDFDTVDPKFIKQAALNGLINRINTSYSGKSDPAEITAIVEKELDNFSQGIFTSRNISERKAKVPDTVLAWVEAAGGDPADTATVQKYAKNWSSRSKEEKEKISSHPKVIEVYERIQYEKRLKRAEEVEVSEDVLDLS